MIFMKVIVHVLFASGLFSYSGTLGSCFLLLSPTKKACSSTLQVEAEGLTHTRPKELKLQEKQLISHVIT